MAPTLTACRGWNGDGGMVSHHDHQCPQWCAAGHPDTERPPVPAEARGSVTFLPGQVTPLRRSDGATGGTRLVYQLDLNRPVPPTTVRPGDDPSVERAAAERGVRALLRLMGEDPTRPGLSDTPARVVKAYLELADRPGDPDVLLSKVFQDVESADSEMIAVPGIAFVSLCEHHLLPFTGTATVAYIPNGGGVVGLSKIPRLVQHYARRPQVQERLTTQIVDALVDRLEPLGAAVLIESSHACMALRGVRAQEATMVTSALRGRFLENPPTRAEFMALATRGK